MRAYYAKNKDKIKEKQREKYNLDLKQKEWYEKESDEKTDEMRQRKREQ